MLVHKLCYVENSTVCDHLPWDGCGHGKLLSICVILEAPGCGMSWEIKLHILASERKSPCEDTKLGQPLKVKIVTIGDLGLMSLRGGKDLIARDDDVENALFFSHKVKNDYKSARDFLEATTFPKTAPNLPLNCPENLAGLVECWPLNLELASDDLHEDPTGNTAQHLHHHDSAASFLWGYSWQDQHQACSVVEGQGGCLGIQRGAESAECEDCCQVNAPYCA